MRPPDSYRRPEGQSVEDFNRDCARAIEEAILWEGKETVAGVIMEPAISGGGVIVPHPVYMEEVQRICDRATVLRHGKVTGACDPRQETPASLARMMVGSNVAEVEKTVSDASGPSRPHPPACQIAAYFHCRALSEARAIGEDAAGRRAEPMTGASQRIEGNAVRCDFY